MTARLAARSTPRASKSLIDTLRALCDAQQDQSDGPRLQQIVLKLGLADPAPSSRRAPRSDSGAIIITVDRIIVAVDALHSLALATNLGRRQIEAADETWW